MEAVQITVSKAGLYWIFLHRQRRERHTAQGRQETDEEWNHKSRIIGHKDAQDSQDFSEHAALTGICRSGGSADTLIREFIRVSGCPPIHVHIADSAACHSSPTNFLFFCRFFFLCIVCIFMANLFPSLPVRLSSEVLFPAT
jgi:hypothetical protein